MVRTLCTSWSHKYEELLNDYQVPNNMLNPLKINEALKKINQAIENPKLFTPSNKIIAALKMASENMWEEIIKKIQE